MTQCVVWIEGVDFSETLFDTQKLSVIRGASRAYEEMPPLARHVFEPFKARQLAAGGSMAGFLVEGEEVKIRYALDCLLLRLTTQGLEPEKVKPAVEATFDAIEWHGHVSGARPTPPPYDPTDTLATCAPFAHLKFLHALEWFSPPDTAEQAFERARAKVRIAQLEDPGVHAHYLPAEIPCVYDKCRPAETAIDGPPTPKDEVAGKSSSRLPVSRACAARWYFGRAQRQRLYDGASVVLDREPQPREKRLVFVDDFQEMTAEPRPRVPKPGGDGAVRMEVPESCKNKIAVFSADGDGFGGLIGRLKAKAQRGNHDRLDGLVWLSTALQQEIGGLLTDLALGLAELRDSADEDESAAVAWDLERAEVDRRQLKAWRGREEADRLLRFETLLCGGDDATFVVPAWLGWWLAIRFFELTKGWTVEDEPIQFSAGLVFAQAKAPIRSLKKLAGELMRYAKDSGGGLEMEVLESVEAPDGGVGALRDRLLGTGWRFDETDATRRATKTVSRLFIPRGNVTATFQTLHETWVGAKNFPTSQAYSALRKARYAGNQTGDQRGGLSGATAQVAASDEIAAYHDRGGAATLPLAKPDFLPLAAQHPALRLHVLLQQRDYILAGGEWTARAAGIPL